MISGRGHLGLTMGAPLRVQCSNCTLTAAGICAAACSSVPLENQVAVASSNGKDPKLPVGPLESQPWAATRHQLHAELTWFVQKGRPWACGCQPQLDGGHDEQYQHGPSASCWTIHRALRPVRRPLPVLPATSAQLREVHAVVLRFLLHLKSLVTLLTLEGLK